MTERETDDREIFVVDDDPAVRQVLLTLFSRAGFTVNCFAESISFMATARERVPVAVVLDVHIPGRSGLDVLRELNAEEYPAPIFVISGHGDIPMAVEAIKNGAFDFIEKPFRGTLIVHRIEAAISAWNSRRANAPSPALPFTGQEQLTRRELEVLTHLTTGASNKEVGRLLGISPRTIEVHRARIMDKLDARNLADLMRIVLGYGRGSMAADTLDLASSG